MLRACAVFLHRAGFVRHAKNMMAARTFPNSLSLRGHKSFVSRKPNFLLTLCTRVSFPKFLTVCLMTELYIIDEAKAVDLFLDCSLPVFVLEQWIADYSDDLLGTFARGVLSDMLVEKKAAYSVVDRVSELSDDAIKQMSASGAVRCPVHKRRSRRGGFSHR